MHSHAERGNERAKNMPEKPKLNDYKCTEKMSHVKRYRHSMAAVSGLIFHVNMGENKYTR